MNAHQHLVPRSRYELVAIIMLVWGLVACQRTPTPTPTLEPTMTTVAATPTLTLTPSPLPATATLTTTSPPTPTPIPYITMTPFPTVTPVGVYPVKQVFIQSGWFGGDGGSIEDFYFGRDTPNLVIYTDGQVIVRIGSWEENFAFLSGQLSSDELCSLLGKLEATGYFNPIDMIYAFDETTQFSDGAGNYVIQVNGPIDNNVGIYEHYTDYLVDEIAAAYQLISTYQPPTALDPYVPERLLLWVEPTTDTDITNLPEWPAEFPRLSELRADPTSSKVIIEGDLILPLLELFHYQMDWQVFREGETAYDVILRPLLPHETPRQFSMYPGQPAIFNLPFSCANVNLPEVIPTPTPTPLVGTLAPEAGALRGRIVFSSDRDGNDEIYVMYADGSHVIRLTNYPGYDSEPVWSPDGQKIAFVSDRSGRKEIYVMNADGTDVTRVTFGTSDKGSPAWSPDGSRIVYVDSHNADFPDFDSEIHWISAQGGGPVQITDDKNRIYDVTPIWLDAVTILYASGSYPDYRLYTIQDDGTNQMPLITGIDPALSPDKTKLVGVFSTTNILVVPLPFTTFADAIDIAVDSSVDYAPAWSPDGQRIVFVSERDGNAELYVANADGSNLIRLTYTAAAEQSPDWTP